MAERQFIVKTPRLEKSQDYAFLRKEGLKHIEKLGHKLWTDYNVHDPGVTILELLCYAVTDLGYRTPVSSSNGALGYHIRDILTETEKGVAVNRSNFHTALEALTSAPVTFDDLRKLLIDVEGVRNAWVEKHTSVKYCLGKTGKQLMDCGGLSGQTENLPLGGLYDVLLEYEDSVVKEPRTARAGLPDNSAGVGQTVQAGGRGIRFHAACDLTLVAVSVYPDASGVVTVRLVDKYGKETAKTVGKVSQAGRKNRIPLDFYVPAGENYLLDARGTGNVPALYRTTALPDGKPLFPQTVEDVIYLVSGAQGPQNLQPYFFFYDWEVSYAVPAGSTEGASLTASAGLTDNRGEGGAIAAAAKGIEFETARDLILESVDVYAGRPGKVAVRLLDAQGQPLGPTAEAKAVAANAKTEVALNFKLKGGRRYRLDASGSDVKLHRTLVAEYPYSVDNVITLIRGHPAPAMFYFFYNWQVRYPEHPRVAFLNQDDVRLSVSNRLHENRNLCEDVVNVCDLEAEEIAVCADIEVSVEADVEETLAEIFYQLDRHVSPRVNFHTIQELQKRGKSTDEIFQGPILDHGFIDEDEFKKIKRQCEVRTSDVIQLLMDVKGVTAIKEISLLSFIDGQFRVQEPWVLMLAANGFRVPRFSSPRSKIIFYKNDLPYFANRDRVKKLIEEKKSAELQTKLKGHQRDLPVPVGRDRELERYTPAQNELPANYRVGRYRVETSETARRKAQSRQLKAYLLFFEQLLANYLSQLAHVRRLFSWEKGIAATYFTQPVSGVAKLEEVFLNPGGLKTALEAIIEDAKTAADRRSRFLEHLIARFCESFTEYSLLMYALLKDPSRARVIEDKRAFLEDYPALSRERSRAYDTRCPTRKDNFSGYRRRVYRLLGIRDLSRRRLAGHRFEIEEVVGSGWRFVLKDGLGGNLFESIFCRTESAVEALLDSALEVGADPDNYQLNPARTAHQLVLHCPGEAEPRILGGTTGLDLAASVAGYFKRVLDSEGFHVIEHILLRKRTGDDPFLPVQQTDPETCDCVAVAEPYSFRMTVLLPSWCPRFQDLKFRRFVEDALRLEAPAHIYVKICWISQVQMKSFEECYDDWSRKLASLWKGSVACRTADAPLKKAPLTGQLPLPKTGSEHEAYRLSLARLIRRLHSLVTVYPTARLHDCKQVHGDQPQVTLNNTSLGTF